MFVVRGRIAGLGGQFPPRLGGQGGAMSSASSETNIPPPEVVMILLPLKEKLPAVGWSQFDVIGKMIKMSSWRY